jgi:DNA polymerase-1
MEKLQNHDWKLSYTIEANFRHIISEQEAYGWKMDVGSMDVLLQKMLIERDAIKKKVRSIAGLRVVQGNTVTKPHKLNGEISAVTERWYNNLDRRQFPLSAIVGTFSRVTFEELNLESPKQRIEVLQKFNWKPTEYNYKVDKHKKPIYDENRKKIKLSPKLTEDSVQGIEVGELMVKYVTIAHRYKLVKGLTERLRPDGAIGSGGITVGCNTGRMMHRGIVNIPRAGEFYGDEIRSLFSHRQGYTLVGADLKSLENRLMGHYTYAHDNGEYARRLEEEDSHDTTAVLVLKVQGKLPSITEICSGCGKAKESLKPVCSLCRGVAKTLNYALGYGAQIGKVQDVLDCSQSDAKQLFKMWWDDKKAMETLKTLIEKSLTGRGHLYKKRLKPDAWIKGLDGRKIYVRSTHSLINCLIQNAGAVVAKFISCSIDKQIKAQGLDAHMVCNYHDEVNLEVIDNPLTIEAIHVIINKAIKKCNDYFKFNIPMDMDIKVGANWKEIH